MRAVVYSQFGVIENLDVEAPIAGAGEVIVDVKAVGICGSELEGFANRSPMRVPPLIMGHEFSGTIAGTNQLVTVNPLLSCGRCDLCDRGYENLCRKRGMIGISRAGGFAEQVAVPKANVVPLLPNTSPQQGALVEPYANAVHAVAKAIVDGNPDRVGIIGAGAIGLAVLEVVLNRTAADVMIADIHDGRLGTARSFGAHQTGDKLEGEFDVVFDCVGLSESRNLSVASLRPGGNAIWIGLHEESAGFDARHLIRLGKQVTGAFAYRNEDFRSALEFAQQANEAWFDQFPMSDGARVFSNLLESRPLAPKTLLIA